MLCPINIDYPRKAFGKTVERWAIAASVGEARTKEDRTPIADTLA